MSEIINLYKQIGETPYQAILKFKQKYPEYQKEKISCAGRLDPLAQGVLLLLIGDENKNRLYYEKLRKNYEFEILFGVCTDTYDLLGEIKKSSSIFNTNLSELQKQIAEIMPSFIGKQAQLYPPYSAVRVKGHPLFYWSRHKKLNSINIPQHQIEIYNLKILDNYLITIKNLEEVVTKNINKVEGNFRQKEILETWQVFYKEYRGKEIPILKMEISCTSGTYVRQFIHDIGKKLKIPTVTFSIKRTAIGSYEIKESVKI